MSLGAVPKSKTHKVEITLRFDKPCTKKQALLTARDCICRFNKPTAYYEKDPDMFQIGTIRSVKAR